MQLPESGCILTDSRMLSQQAPQHWHCGVEKKIADTQIWKRYKGGEGRREAKAACAGCASSCLPYCSACLDGAGTRLGEAVSIRVCMECGGRRGA